MSETTISEWDRTASSSEMLLCRTAWRRDLALLLGTAAHKETIGVFCSVPPPPQAAVLIGMCGVPGTGAVPQVRSLGKPFLI